MRRKLGGFVGGVALVATTLSGCASEGSTKAAAELTTTLGALPGVASASRTVGSNEGTAVVRVTVVLTEQVTAEQVAAIAGPVTAATRGDHALTDLKVAVERGPKPTGAAAASTLELNSRDTPAVVEPVARRFLQLCTVLGTTATVGMATAGQIGVTSLSPAADPIEPVATLLSRVPEPVDADVEIAHRRGTSEVRSLRTRGWPTADVVARWHSMSAALVQLSDAGRTGLSQEYRPTGLSSIRAHLALGPDIAPDQLTVDAYAARLRPMINAQLRNYVLLGPNAEYVLDYNGADGRDGRLVWIGPGGVAAVPGGGIPAPRPAGWNDLALDYLRTLR